MKFKIGLIQMDVGADLDKNLRKAKGLVERAARRGANIVCLPELFHYMGPFKKFRGAAETGSGPSISLMRGLARKYKIHIVAGSILEKCGGRKPRNTCFAISPAGRIICRYSKMHLFDINIPGKIRMEESKAMSPGRQATIVKTKFGTLGFAICNDLRYPELFRRMVMAGAEIIFVMAAFTKFTGRDHWLALNRVRAIENQCYIVAVNQSGKSASGIRFFGSSIAVDPWGRIIAEGPPRGDAVILCDVDLGLAMRLRRHLPALGKIRASYHLKRW